MILNIRLIKTFLISKVKNMDRYQGLLLYPTQSYYFSLGKLQINAIEKLLSLQLVFFGVLRHLLVLMLLHGSICLLLSWFKVVCKRSQAQQFLVCYRIYFLQNSRQEASLSIRFYLNSVIQWKSWHLS